MSTYTHLTQEERYPIQTIRKQKFSLSDMAESMGRNKGTIIILICLITWNFYNEKFINDRI